MAAGRLVPLAEVLRTELGPQWRIAARTRDPSRRVDTGAVHIALTASTGCRGAGEGEFSDPFFAIPLPDGSICVSDYGNHRLQIVSVDGEPLQTIGQRGRRPGDFTRPLGLALCKGQLFVVDGTDRIQQLDRDFKPVTSFGSGGYAPCVGASELSPIGGTLETRRLWEPYGIAMSGSGQIYVTDKGKHRVAVLGEHGDFCFAFGSQGTGAANFDDPRGIAVHAEQVWVADMCNHRISIFSLDGSPRGAFGSHGQRHRRFHFPVGIALSANLVFVSEYIGSCIYVLSTEGECLQTVQAPFGDAYACALASNELHVVLTDTNCRLLIFEIIKPGPVPCAGLSGADILHLERDSVSRSGKRARAATREERVGAALRASDFRGVLDALTQEDIHALVPRAYAHAEKHPELYRLPQPHLPPKLE